MPSRKELLRPGVRPSGEWSVDADLCREYNKRGLGRVADNLSGIGDGGVAVKAETVGEQREIRRRLARYLRDSSDLGVTLALDEVPPAMDVQRPHRHLVHRQRAGLIGVDGARGTGVSTSVRFFTTAFASASWRAPYASMAWTKVGRPSGLRRLPSQYRAEEALSGPDHGLRR